MKPIRPNDYADTLIYFPGPVLLEVMEANPKTKGDHLVFDVPRFDVVTNFKSDGAGALSWTTLSKRVPLREAASRVAYHAEVLRRAERAAAQSQLNA
jgi:hypothetical protein